MAAPANADARRRTVLTALTHEALKAGEYDSLADLIAEVKVRAARMRIPYDADQITEAVTAVGHVRLLPLVQGVVVPFTPHPPEPAPEPPIVDREGAAAIMRELKRRNPKPAAAPAPEPPALTEVERLQARVRDTRDRLAAAAKPSPTVADLQRKLQQVRERIEAAPQWKARQSAGASVDGRARASGEHQG